MEPRTIEMSTSDQRTWTVTFTEQANGSFVAEARSGTERRTSHWSIGKQLRERLFDLEGLVDEEALPDWFRFDRNQPDARAKWSLSHIVRVFRKQIDEVVARDGSGYVIEELSELIGLDGASASVWEGPNGQAVDWPRDHRVRIGNLKLERLRCFQSLDQAFVSPESDAQGQWIVVLGENGVGKTTLLRAIALALLPDNLATTHLTRLSSVRGSGYRSHARIFRRTARQ